MASKGMTLNAVIKLTATQFNAGIKQVQRSLNSLKTTFLQIAGAIGAGLGIGTLVRELKDTAVQLSIAKATLENVADNGVKYGKDIEKGVKDLAKANAEYASNMAFLKRIANAYGQDLLGLTQAFAKFRAAAGYAGVSLEEIKRIYEALTKAAGAYHLTAEQTANAMLAVEQMFSKGKVTAEELRRQLGNALPGAFGLMAKAAKMSTGEFEVAMKKGQIIAKDVLPAFADELNKITNGANFDSLQSSLNRFSNAWTYFAEKTNFEGLFKKLVDGGAKALNFLGNNFKQVSQAAVAAISGIFGGKVFTKLEKEGTKSLKVVQKEYANLEKQAVQLIGKQEQYTKQLEATEALSKRWTNSYVNVDGITEAEARLAGLDQKLIDTAKAEGKLGTTTIKTSQAQVIYSQRLKETQAQLDANKVSMAGYESKMKMSTTAIGRAFIGLKTVGTAAMSALNTALTSIGIGLLISVLTQALAKLMDILSFSNKLKKQAEQIDREVHTINADIEAQIAEVKTIANVINDTSTSEEKRKEKINKLNGLLGLSNKKALTFKSTADEINTAIEKWSDNLVKASSRLAIFNKIGELTTRNLEIDQEISQKQGKIDNRAWNSGWLYGQIERLRAEKKQNEEFIEKLRKEAENITKELTEETSGYTGGGGGGGGGSTDKLKKAIDDYKESLKELKNQEQNGSISKKEFEEETDKLAEKTWKAITAFDNYEKVLKSLGGTYSQLGAEIKTAFEKAQADKAAAEAKEAADKAEKEYERLKAKFDDIVNDPLPKRGSRDTFFDYKKSPKDKMDEEADLIDDYLKKLESLREKIEELKRDAGDKWSAGMQRYLDMLIKKIGITADEAKTIREQANFAELTEDIKQMQAELNKVRFDGIKDIGQAVHSLSESVFNLIDAIEELSGADEEDKKQREEDLKQLKALMAVIDELTQMYNTFMSIYKMFTEASEKKAKLEAALAQQETIFAQQSMANKQQEIAIEGESAANTMAMESAKQVAMHQTMATEAQSVGTTVSAEATKQGSIAATTSMEAGGAVVGAMNSVASVPYVGPILAAAAAATITALIMAALSKFATGGIVGGNSTSGDKNIVRANSGELILNKAQQGHLWNMINGKESMGAGKVEFVLRGDRLLGAINNYQSKVRG